MLDHLEKVVPLGSLPGKTHSSAQPRHASWTGPKLEDLALRAYQIYERTGKDDAGWLEHWRLADRELRTSAAAPNLPEAAKTQPA